MNQDDLTFFTPWPLRRWPVWMVTSVRALQLFGLVLFGATAFLLPHAPAGLLSESFKIENLALQPVLGIMLVYPLVMLHELSHMAALKAVGFRTKLTRHGRMHFGVSAPDQVITRNQNLICLNAPTIPVNLVGLIGMLAFEQLRPAFAIALSIHLGGCLSDLVMINVFSALPASTRFLDSENGMYFSEEAAGHPILQELIECDGQAWTTIQAESGPN